MKCTEIQDLLSPFLDKELDLEKELLVREHLANCRHCRQELANLTDTILLIKSIADIPIPHNFQNQLRKRLISLSKKNRRKVFIEKFVGIFPPYKWYLGTAVILLFVLLSYLPVFFSSLKYDVVQDLAVENMKRDQVYKNKETVKNMTENENISKNNKTPASDTDTKKVPVRDQDLTQKGVIHKDKNKSEEINSDFQISNNILDDKGSNKEENVENNLPKRMFAMSAPVQSSASPKQIMRTGYLELETSNYQESLESIRSLPEKIPGLTISIKSTQGLVSENKTSIVMFVPKEEYSHVIDEISGLGKTTRQSSSEYDLTKDMNDLKSRLVQLQEDEKKSEKPLKQIHAEIDRCNGRLEELSKNINNIEITIVLKEIRN